MDHNLLAASASILLALALAYVPGLAPRFDKLSGPSKRLAVLVCLVVIAAGSQALACYPPLASLVPGLACTPMSVGGTVSAFVSALVANQGTYVLAVEGVK